MSKKILFILLGFYLSLGGIYWFPNVNEVLLSTTKYVFLISSIVVFLFNNRLKLPRKWKYLLFFMLFSTALFTLRDVSQDSVKNLISFTIGIIVLLIGYTLSKNINDIINLYKFVLFFSCILLLIILLSYFNIIPSINNPNGIPIHKSGFNFKSTGWSFWLCQITPIVFILNSKGLKRKIFIIIILFIILYTQFISGGRGGFFASFFSILIFLYITNIKSFGIKSILSIFLISFSALFLIIYYEQDFIDFIYRNKDSTATISDLSTNRALQWILLPSLIDEQIIIGYGYFGSLKLFESIGLPWELHNTYIRTIIDYGIILSIPIIIFFIKLFGLSYRILFSNKREMQNKIALSFSLIILNSLFIGMIEANTLVGSFQNSVISWFSIGVLIKFVQLKPHELNSKFE